MDLLSALSSRRARRHAVVISFASLSLATAGARHARAEDAPRAAPRVVKVAGNPSQSGAEKSSNAANEPEREPVLVRPFMQIICASFDFDTNDGNTSLEIVPNPTTNLGVTLGAWGLGLSLTTTRRCR